MANKTIMQKHLQSRFRSAYSGPGGPKRRRRRPEAAWRALIASVVIRAVLDVAEMGPKLGAADPADGRDFLESWECGELLQELRIRRNAARKWLVYVDEARAAAAGQEVRS
jgi:hypothetical protein